MSEKFVKNEMRKSLRKKGRKLKLVNKFQIEADDLLLPNFDPLLIF
jgi:hypothetical protein